MQYPFCLKTVISIIVLYSWNIKSADIAQFQKPSTPPKYFGIDVDGTFFVKDEAVFRKNIEAFKLLKSKNITPFFCTGSDRFSNKKLLGDSFFTETGYDGFPGIYDNGALVYGPDGSLIKIEKFSEEFLDKINEHMTNNNINSRVIYMNEDKLYSVQKLDDDVLNYLKSFNYEPTQSTFEEIKKKNIVSIGFNSDNFEITGLTKDTDYIISFGEAGVAQLTPPGINKRSGIEALLNHYNSNANECAYIGDSQNDHEAMEFCYVSFAVGNADDDTKQKAKWVLDLNYDKGAFEKAVKLLTDSL
ncbi:HAD-superfamily hydrolase, subfamily IIB protein [Theileria orientalis strain Shintoku]|uniref:HAD-superfamily hydrolase, subfamily IIB protein n=1 Tax=Theileria orientalis strain Shintoku TaxID=869250 RepID=J4DNU5_THEOR|nr:HAD-superfamily hydrolase, subfamily IIB protein [Theileria orientalis strain Shintoku]BAM39569.1 HAD-superfamily hydrolase, subfamily IIB protein [Theileria orientalis strain Shintoku]|eukprot:XP_009689870.1 HAD-superfamily hydrolase, subfamily IIB protein [Theileria orientalis strain Shintoku]